MGIPVDDALVRLERCIDWREGRGRERAAEALATVREELQRLREEQADYAGYGEIMESLTQRAEAAEAEARRLTEGLRDARRELDNIGRWAGHPNNPTPCDWALVVAECEQSVSRIDALLAAPAGAVPPVSGEGQPDGGGAK